MFRRRFLSLAALPAALAGAKPPQATARKFRISLAEWSLHKAIHSRLMTNLDFPRAAREQFGIDGLEFVNQLWEAPTQSYVQSLRNNMRQTGTLCVLMMCDGEGNMGAPDAAERMRAADNHRKWVDITAELGGHSVRLNMSPGAKQPSTPAEIDAFLGHCVESFARICEYAAKARINVIIENHGGISSNPDVLVKLMGRARLTNLGTLPDFGNFPKEIDRYEAVRKMMPYAKGVSFKCYDFSPDARETTIDMDRMMKIVAEAGYNDWVGIEYEGSRLPEFEGIIAARRCLQRYL